MEKVSIKIGGKKYKVEIADTDEKKAQGFQGMETLPKDEGMLFVFTEPEEVSM